MRSFPIAITEEQVRGTTRQYTRAQNMTNVALSIVSNQTAFDTTLSNSYTLDMTANTELQLPTVDVPGSYQIRVTNGSSFAFTLAAGYRLIGEIPTPGATDDILINIASFGDNAPFVVASIEGASLSDSGVQVEDINTLFKLNSIITDATLIDTSDTRLSDARTPLSHTHTASEITDFNAASDARVAASDKISSDPTGVAGADAVVNLISLTQAEYDAIVTPDASTVYIITDA